MSKAGLAVSARVLVIPFLSFFSVCLWAEAPITSSFGFSAEMPDDEWFVVGPKEVAKLSQNESLDSLGVQKIPDDELLGEILEKVKSGNIEFFYDGRYIRSDFKNHVSAQLDEPLVFDSVEEMRTSFDEQCASLPEELSAMYGEAVELHSCQLAAMNERAIFHHAYTLSSQKITIINEQIPVNSNYSIIFVGGSGNDNEGLYRVRAAQQALVEAATAFLKNQASKR